MLVSEMTGCFSNRTRSLRFLTGLERSNVVMTLYNHTRRYSPLRNLTFSSCGELWPWAKHFWAFGQFVFLAFKQGIEVPKGIKGTIPFPMLLFAVPETVFSHTKTRSKSAVQSIFCVAPRCPRGSLVPYKSEENQFHSVLALLGTGAPMGETNIYATRTRLYSLAWSW